MRYGGYPEQVKAMTYAMRDRAQLESSIENKTVILTSVSGKYKSQVLHDGIYAQGMLMSLDDEQSETDEGENAEVKRPEKKRTMYIFCGEGDTDALFTELDKKTSIPLIPDFKDYILDVCLKRGVLEKLTVLSKTVRFDAYSLTMRNDEKEMEEIVNQGLKTGRIVIPGIKKENGLKKITSVSQYLNKYGITIADRIKKSFNPLFDPASEDISAELKVINENLKSNVGYSLYPAQLAVAESVKCRLDNAKFAMIVAECGSGKTKIGSAALGAYQKGKKCLNVVLCPSHVTKKWVREIKETLPNTKAEVIYNLADIDRLCEEFKKGKKSIYMIISKERARDGYMRRPAVIHSKMRGGYVCPWCGSIVVMKSNDEDTDDWINADQFFFKKENNKNHSCRECGKPLWTALNPKDKKLSHNKWIKISDYGFIYRDFAERHLSKTKNMAVIEKITEIMRNPDKLFIAKGAHVRYGKSDYIAKHLKSIDGCILDELHQFKGDSGQGKAMETLVGASRKVIGMTATLINGYSSGMFYLLYRIVPHLMQADNKKYDSPNDFNNEYGVTETAYELREGEYNANSKSCKKLLHTRQKPGVSPLVYSRFLIDCAVFLSLNDLGKHLPDYEEIPVELNMRADIKEEYDKLKKAFTSVMNTRNGDAMKLMSKFFSLLTTYPDQPYEHEPIYFPKSDIAICEPQDLSCFEELHEKDETVLKIVDDKVVGNGERVLIYTSSVKIDTQTKLKNLLEDKGYRVAILEQKVPPEKREEWVEKRVKEGLDILITNPSLVETGLDLNAFTTLIYYNIGYNLFTFRQSSRRSWRINQTADKIEVYILYYADTLQARAIRLMASKLAAATLVEGNFSEEGLAAMSDCQDLTSQLAMELTKGLVGEVEDVKSMFKKMAITKETEIKENSGKSEHSISEKLKMAMLLAKQAKGNYEKTSVRERINYGGIGEQISLFEVA